MAKATLQTLPAELRNNIYELVFASDEEQEEAADICKATPLAKDVLLTCKQFYREAGEMYREKCRTYWSSTAFYVDTLCHKSDTEKENFQALDEEDLEHITSFTVISKRSNYQLGNGVWSYITRSQGVETIHWYRAEKFVESSGAVRFEEWRNGRRLYDYEWTPTGERVGLKEQIDELGVRLIPRWSSFGEDSST